MLPWMLYKHGKSKVKIMSEDGLQAGEIEAQLIAAPPGGVGEAAGPREPDWVAVGRTGSSERGSSQRGSSQRTLFSRQECWLLIVAGASIFLLLLVARCLTPNPTGMGTHQRLGLPPCGFVVMFGMPCPSCGMTTSWSWLTRGDLIRSWQANPGGLSLGLFVGVMAPWMLISGIRGHWWPLNCSPLYVLAAGLLVIAISVTQWVIRISM